MKEAKVLITGASSGIGEGCARRFAAEGSDLILCARTYEKVKALGDELAAKYKVKVHSAQCDVRDRKMVESFIESIPADFKPIDVLVNNAGLARGLEKITDNLVEDWEEMIDTNIKGLLYATRASIPLMKGSSVGGVIINIGSLAGVASYPNGAVYCATKAAVRILSDGMRQDLVDTPIRVTTIQPGMVETGFNRVRFQGDVERAAAVYKGVKPLTGDDIADCVYYAASRPPYFQICEITVTPTQQATGGVIHRK